MDWAICKISLMGYLKNTPAKPLEDGFSVKEILQTSTSLARFRHVSYFETLS